MRDRTLSLVIFSLQKLYRAFQKLHVGKSSYSLHMRHNDTPLHPPRRRWFHVRLYAQVTNWIACMVVPCQEAWAYDKVMAKTALMRKRLRRACLSRVQLGCSTRCTRSPRNIAGGTWTSSACCTGRAHSWTQLRNTSGTERTSLESVPSLHSGLCVDCT